MDLDVHVAVDWNVIVVGFGCSYAFLLSFAQCNILVMAVTTIALFSLQRRRTDLWPPGDRVTDR